MILKHGSQSEDVKSVQEILKQLGYKPGPVDGQYGGKTEAAVIQFQEALTSMPMALPALVPGLSYSKPCI